MPVCLSRWLPAVLWMAVIFAASSFSRADGEPGIGPWDKLAHLVAYGILGWLIARAMFEGRRITWAGVVLVTLLATLYGMSDEFHQSFVPGREVSAGDLAADAAGALLGAGILYWLHARRSVPANRGAA